MSKAALFNLVTQPQEVIRGVRRLGLKGALLHVLRRENIETIPAMFEFAKDVGADHVVFEIVFAFEPRTLLRPDELGRAAELLASCAERAKVSSNAQEIVAQLEAERRACSGTDEAPLDSSRMISCE